jgi:hypothetical protein
MASRPCEPASSLRYTIRAMPIRRQMRSRRARSMRTTRRDPVFLFRSRLVPPPPLRVASCVVVRAYPSLAGTGTHRCNDTQPRGWVVERASNFSGLRDGPCTSRQSLGWDGWEVHLRRFGLRCRTSLVRDSGGGHLNILLRARRFPSSRAGRTVRLQHLRFRPGRQTPSTPVRFSEPLSGLIAC